MEIKTISPEMCECGRLYKDRKDKSGKMICVACYIGLSVDDIKKLWETPTNSLIKKRKPNVLV
jgi:hypothetical protein